MHASSLVLYFHATLGGGGSKGFEVSRAPTLEGLSVAPRVPRTQ